jgi:hypothetical protein
MGKYRNTRHILSLQMSMTKNIKSTDKTFSHKLINLFNTCVHANAHWETTLEIHFLYLVNKEIYYIFKTVPGVFPALSVELEPWTFVARITPSYLIPLNFPSCPEFTSYLRMIEEITPIPAVFKLCRNFHLGHGG